MKFVAHRPISIITSSSTCIEMDFCTFLTKWILVSWASMLNPVNFWRQTLCASRYSPGNGAADVDAVLPWVDNKTLCTDWVCCWALSRKKTTHQSRAGKFEYDIDWVLVRNYWALKLQNIRYTAQRQLNFLAQFSFRFGSFSDFRFRESWRKVQK